MARTRWRTMPALLLALILGATLMACGSVDAGGPATSGFVSEVVPNQIAVNAEPRGTLRWEKQAYEGLAGDVTFVVGNPSTVAHNFVLEGNGIKAASKTI